MVVVGGGPAGATAANDLANLGRKVALIDRSGRIKPCGGAIPPRLIKDFEIPNSLLKARVNKATMVSPRGASVDMPIEHGFVGMVDREEFDEWLRARAERSGVKRISGKFETINRDRRRFAAHPFSAEDGPRIDAIGQGAGGHWSRRRQLDSRTARGAARRSRAFCLRLSRSDPNAARRDDRPPLRDTLPGYALARLLCLDLPAWRDDERRVPAARGKDSR